MSEIPAAAVEAVARWLAARAGWDHPGPWAEFKHRKFYTDEALDLLVAAAPLIRQAADKIAAEIEATRVNNAPQFATIARRVGGGGGGGQ